MGTRKKICLVFLIITVCCFTIMITLATVGKTTTSMKLVDCYDENDNKILNLQCEEKVIDGEYDKLISGLFLVCFFCAIGIGTTAATYNS